MPEDFLNGLNIVPLDASHAILSSTAASLEHPWRDLFQEREPSRTHSDKTPYTKSAPARYTKEYQLYGPPARDDTASATHSTFMLQRRRQSRAVELHETVRLCDVEAFRIGTAERARAHLNGDQMGALSAGLSRLSTSPMISRPVIYRFIDVIKSSMALLEAIHFELFMPDRADLRFLAVPLATVPCNTTEGDFFHVHCADLLAAPSFAVKLGQEQFPVVWETRQIRRIAFASQFDQEGLAYIVKKKGNTHGGEYALSELADADFFIREPCFPDQYSRREHSLVRVSMKKLLTAHLYAVEPPLPPLTTEPKTEPIVPSVSGGFGRGAPISSHSSNSRGFGAKAGEEEPRSEYLKRVTGAQSSSQRSGSVVSEVRALSARDTDRIRDRLGAFTSYGQEGDLELMDELFRLGSRYRVSVSQGADTKDAGEMKIDESVILKTISDKEIGSLDRCLTLLDCIYGRNNPKVVVDPHLEQCSVTYVDGSGGFKLNERQSRAVRMYMDPDGPRVFCILSPPGSGKTTVAAAMAAEVGRAGAATVSSYTRGRMGGGGVQLLLSVQNVAVDNMGAVLKKLDFGGGEVYNMKSSKKLDPHNPAPCDFFDLMGEEELGRWRNNQIPMQEEVMRRGRGRNRAPEVVRFQTKEERLTHHRREFEKNLSSPKILLSTVEMVLQKLYTSSKLCDEMGRVTRVIIDEASLLTEAALFCIIRRFPEARIVLIGDDRQLPPFMYDKKILGHELAGRPALTVAMTTGQVPLVELNEVYRAPPSLVAPYNRLAYGGRLVSKKPEGEVPLSAIGLIPSGFAQLLLIDVDGREERNERNMSLYNEKELDALVRLLHKFPREWTKDIMIICLYKEQKRRLQDILDRQHHRRRLEERQQHTQNGHGQSHDGQYTVLTVDSAQGKESPIVILMTTRTQRATDFFCSYERCNVAISRQQKALIILGNVPLLTTNQPWATVINEDDFTRVRAEDIK